MLDSGSFTCDMNSWKQEKLCCFPLFPFSIALTHGTHSNSYSERSRALSTKLRKVQNATVWHNILSIIKLTSVKWKFSCFHILFSFPRVSEWPSFSSNTPANMSGRPKIKNVYFAQLEIVSWTLVRNNLQKFYDRPWQPDDGNFACIPAVDREC